MYNVKFNFFDGETVEVAVNDHDLDKFLNVIGENKVFFNDAKTAGTWLNGSQVRFFQAVKVSDDHEKESVAKVGDGKEVFYAESEVVA